MSEELRNRFRRQAQKYNWQPTPRKDKKPRCASPTNTDAKQPSTRDAFPRQHAGKARKRQVLGDSESESDLDETPLRSSQERVRHRRSPFNKLCQNVTNDKPQAKSKIRRPSFTMSCLSDSETDSDLEILSKPTRPTATANPSRVTSDKPVTRIDWGNKFQSFEFDEGGEDLSGNSSSTASPSPPPNRLSVNPPMLDLMSSSESEQEDVPPRSLLRGNDQIRSIRRPAKPKPSRSTSPTDMMSSLRIKSLSPPVLSLRDSPPRRKHKPAVRTEQSVQKASTSKSTSRDPFVDFQKNREQHANALFRRFNSGAFGNQLVLGGNITLKWSKKLTKTAGQCVLMTVKGQRQARIEMATKVLDRYERLKQTLCHEMCHAMAWIMDSTRRPPHGNAFWKWANRAMAEFEDIHVTTCHSYKIHCKFQWRCISCSQTFGRHSKSIDTTKHKCGRCRGDLEFMGQFKADGSKAKSRAPTPFSIFVKENFKHVRAANPGSSHGEVMKLLSKEFKARKA